MPFPGGIITIICLVLSVRHLVHGISTQEVCSIGDVDRDLEEDTCTDTLGNHIETHKSIVSTVPNGAICTFTCIDGEPKSFLKKCTNGVWEGQAIECGTDEDYSMKKKLKRKRRGFLFWSSSSSSEEPPPPPPNTAPAMRNCPNVPSTIYAGRSTTYAIVRWSPPLAYDKEQGYIAVTKTGVTPGGRFYERTTAYVIKYRATDNKGLRAECTDSFRIVVIVCSKPTAPSHGSVTCNMGRLIYGSSCSYGCHSGFSVSGPTTVTCEQNGRFLSTSTTCTDVTAPKFTSCPTTQTFFAKRNQRTTTVTWPSLAASDNSGYSVSITQTGGPTKGSVVSTGRYQIQYSAEDRSGHKSDPCIFTIDVKDSILRLETEVQNGRYWSDVTLISDPGSFKNSALGNFNACKEVTKCQTPSIDFLNYTCTTTDFLFGTTCQLSCEYGYSLTGGNSMTCEQTSPPTDIGEWTAAPQPVCVKVRCTLPNPPTAGTVVCTDNNVEWGESCTISCNDGYRLMGSNVLTCLKDGEFNNDVPECVDDVPPVFNSCPPSIMVYADRNMRRAVATWLRPHATDNLGDVAVTQRKGYKSGSLFNSGNTQVYFDAIDAAGNKAKACIFTVTVILVKCPLPNLRDDFLLYECSEPDYLFGTACSLSCPSGMAVDGSDKIICESKPSNALGVWVENKNTEPRCLKEIKCPALIPPKNGVVVCEAYSGVCQIQCNNRHDSNRIYSKKDDVMFVCGSSGKWIPNSAIFDCSEEQSSRPRLPNESFYYDGHCQNKTTKGDIESNFEDAFLASTFGRGCGGRCTFDQLYINCN